jgi:hypothetical protein
MLSVYGQIRRDHDESGQALVIEIVLFRVITDRIQPVRETGCKRADVTISSKVILVVAGY